MLFSSTHLRAKLSAEAQARRGYRWALDDYDIFSVRIDGQEIQRLTATPGYDAEATVSPDGKTIVFTSERDGDLELYAMDLDGSNARRLTDEVGYDGGAFFSPDSSRIVYRAAHPADPAEYPGTNTAEATAGRTRSAGNFCHECRRERKACCHRKWRVEFFTVLSSRRTADHLFLQRTRSTAGRAPESSISF